MLEKLSKFTNTFKDFQKWLFEVAYKRNKETYKQFTKLPEDIYLWAFVAYLEYKGLPLTDAFNYHNYDYPKAGFKDKYKNMILKEFERIENKQETETK